MKKQIVVIIGISLAIGVAVGLIAGRLTYATPPHDHSHEEQKPAGHDDAHTTPDTGAMHKHETLAADPAKAPTVALKVTKDSKAGWYVRVDTTNFTFTPQNANLPNILGEGHAHLYVDGKIVSRLYGPDFHYRDNFTGTKTFKVTLNGNTHADYTVNGQVVSAEQQVTDDRK